MLAASPCAGLAAFVFRIEPAYGTFATNKTVGSRSRAMVRNSAHQNPLLKLATSFAAVVCLCIGLADMALAADKRVALVIGNSDYKNVSQLPNPSRDADAIGALLKKAGFDVVDARTNLGGSDMRRLIRDFSDKVTGADIAVVFYAGHGIEVDGNNYLLPIDTRLERDLDVEDEAVSLERIVRIIEPAKKLRLVILDACRDNPFAKTMKRSLSTRSAGPGGLAKVEPTSPNTLIAYAAKAGSTANDGDGANSPFTTALLKQLAVPGQDVRRSFGFVRDAVLKATGNKQEPYVYGSLGGEDVTLVAAAAAQVAALDPDSKLRRDYELALQVNTKQGWDAFIAAHPTGFLGDLAKAARSKLDQRPAVAALTPPEQRSADPNAINPYVGKSYRLTFLERQEQLTPDPGKISTPGREIVVFVKSPTETTTRITQLPTNPELRSSRFYEGTLGSVDRGIQVLFDKQLQMVAMSGGGSFRIKASITATGNTCKGQVTFELLPNHTAYELRRMKSGEPTTMKSLTAQNLACWVTPGDLVGQTTPNAQAKPN